MDWAPRKVSIVRPSRESDEVGRLAATCLRRAEDEGFAITTIRTERGRLVGEAPERTVELLPITDAFGLYRDLHRASVLVIAFTAVHVRKDPSKDPPARRAALPLETFVRHKGMFALIRHAGEMDVAFRRYESWPAAEACSSADDPRVLPLHVFETSGDWSTLDDPATVAEFAEEYGSASLRRDEGDKVWERAHHFHGRDVLVVAGFALQVGMHWDVSSRRRVRLWNSREVWVIDGRRRRGYVNVSPDANVRSGQNVRGARRVWPQ